MIAISYIRKGDFIKIDRDIGIVEVLEISHGIRHSGLKVKTAMGEFGFLTLTASTMVELNNTDVCEIPL